MLGDRKGPMTVGEPTRLVDTPVTGPLRLNLSWILSTLGLALFVACLAALIIPKSYQAASIVSVVWNGDRLDPSDGATAQILQSRLSRELPGTAKEVAVAQTYRPSNFLVSFRGASGPIAAAKLDDIVGHIVTNPVKDEERERLGTSLADSEKRLAALSEEARSVPVLMPSSVSGADLDADGAAEADIALSSAEAASATSKTSLASAIASRDAAQRDLSSLGERYGPRHPAIIQAHLEFDAAQAAVVAAEFSRTASLTNLKNSRSQAQAAHSAERVASKTKLDQTALLQRLAAESSFHEGLADQLKTGYSNYPYAVHIVQRARPSSTGSPSNLTIIASGLILGFLATLLIVVTRERLVKGFRQLEAIEASCGRPIVGIVPELTANKHSTPLDPAKYLLEHPDSILALSFRKIVLSILDGRVDHRSVAICSALPAEGKTTVALCLARSAASSGLRTIVLDCDGRRGALSKSLPGRSKAGLAEILDGQASIQDALEIDVSGSYFIRHSADPAFRDFAQPQLIAGVVATLSSDFDLILLDTPPVLALVASQVIAALADDTLFVVRWRKTPRAASRAALRTLSKARANVQALVATRVFVSPPQRRLKPS